MSAVTAKIEAVKNKKPRKKKSMAESADRHALYEKSVQSVDVEYKFVSKIFRKLRGRRPRHMREDFCGTAGMCCEWVRRDSRNTAVGVDIDPEVRELLDEAGFSRVTVYWEESDPNTGEGTGVYSPATRGSADPGWVCFLGAEK
jgi:hypothetical protein